MPGSDYLDNEELPMPAWAPAVDLPSPSPMSDEAIGAATEPPKAQRSQAMTPPGYLHGPPVIQPNRPMPPPPPGGYRGRPGHWPILQSSTEEYGVPIGSRQADQFIGFGNPDPEPAAHTLGISLLILSAGSFIGFKLGGHMGSVAGSLYGGATLNFIRSARYAIKNTNPENKKEAQLSAGYGLLTAGIATYIWMKYVVPAKTLASAGDKK